MAWKVYRALKFEGLGGGEKGEMEATNKDEVRNRSVRIWESWTENHRRNVYELSGPQSQAIDRISPRPRARTAVRNVGMCLSKLVTLEDGSQDAG